MLNFTCGGMLLNRLVEIIGDGRAIGLDEEVSPSIDQRTVNATENSLDDGLDVPTESPQASGKVPVMTRNTKFEKFPKKLQGRQDQMSNKIL